MALKFKLLRSFVGFFFHFFFNAGRNAERTFDVDGLLSFSFVSLALLVPRNASPTRQRYAIYVWLTASVTLFSVLLSVFRMKNGGNVIFEL